MAAEEEATLEEALDNLREAAQRIRAVSTETSPTTAQRMGGARPGRMRLHDEKARILELVANLKPWHPFYPTLGQLGRN